MKLSLIYFTGVICLSSFVTHGAEQKTTAAEYAVSLEQHIAAHRFLMALRAPKSSHKQPHHWNVVCNKQKREASSCMSTPGQSQLQQPPISRQLFRPVDAYSRQQDKLTSQPRTVLGLLKNINSHPQG
jgi:hypothetical protein